MPPLAGADFLMNWQGKTLGDLYEKTQTTMPATAPGTLMPAQVADILAFYDEVHAHECYLRTSRREDSVRDLVARLGYRPQCLHHDDGLLIRLSDTDEPVLELAYCGYSGSTTIRSTAAATNASSAPAIDGCP